MTIEFKRSPAPHGPIYAEGDPRDAESGQMLLAEGDLRDFFRRHPDAEWISLPLAGGGFLKLTRAAASA